MWFLMFTTLFFGLLSLFGVIVLKIVYFCCVGLPIAIILGTFGILCCITIIGIPLGKLFFRLAGFVLTPFS